MVTERQRELRRRRKRREKRLKARIREAIKRDRISKGRASQKVDTSSSSPHLAAEGDSGAEREAPSEEGGA